MNHPLRVSFEVFPPKTPEGLVQLAATADRLHIADPTYVSVTYGAGGTDRHRSFQAIDAVLASGVEVAAHLTCVGQSRDDIDAVVARYHELGVSQIVALRGDPPTGIDAAYEPHPHGYQRTADLVAAVARPVRGVRLGLPRTPPAVADVRTTTSTCSRARSTPAPTRAMTQMFFDNAQFPPLPRSGRAPAASTSRSCQGSSRSTRSPPSPASPLVAAPRCRAWIAERFAGLDDDPAATHAVAAELAAAQIAELAAEGVEPRPRLHAEPARPRARGVRTPRPRRVGAGLVSTADELRRRGRRTDPRARRRERHRDPAPRAHRGRPPRPPLLPPRPVARRQQRPDRAHAARRRARAASQLPRGRRRHHLHQHLLVDHRRPARVRARRPVARPRDQHRGSPARREAADAASRARRAAAVGRRFDRAHQRHAVALAPRSKTPPTGR